MRILWSWIRTVTDLGLTPFVPPGTCTGNRGVNPGVTPAFNAEYNAAINVAVN